MSVAFGKHFEILDVRRKHDAERLEGKDGFSIAEDGVARSVYEHFRSKAQTAIIEYNYIDSDFRAGFARFHYMRHHDTSRRCTRIHFFSDLIKPEHLESDQAEFLPAAYLGYTSLRPLPGYRIGRTAFSDKLAPVFDGLQSAITCKAGFRANLAGHELRFSAVPFIQQDRLTSACASAAIWIVSVLMSHKFGPLFRQYNTSEITDLANKYIISTGRPMPSLGLTLEQMMYGLAEMGYEPVLHVSTSARDARQIATAYVESGIPVIISLSFQDARDGHAVAIVGHTVDPAMPPGFEEEKPLKFCRASDYTRHFVFQDDSTGPFRSLEFLEWHTAVKEKRIDGADVQSYNRVYSCFGVIDRGRPTEEGCFIDAFILPFPPGVTLDAGGAEDHAISLIAAWHEVSGTAPPPESIVRTILQPSNTLKQFWTPAHGLDRRVSIELRRHLMSKWAWVTEFGDLAKFKESGSVRGQVVQDSASHPEDAFLEKDLLAFHMPGHLDLVHADGSYVGMRVPMYDDYDSFRF